MATDQVRGASDFELGIRSVKDGTEALAEHPLEAELPDRRRHTPTYHLIRLHHMQSGATRWDREKFRRLCVAFNETEEEMGMRIGLSPYHLRQKLLGSKFTTTEGILLELHWRWVQESCTGLKPEGTALAPK